MEYRYLGKERLKVSAVGYGCPPFQEKLNDADEKQAIDVLHRAGFPDRRDHRRASGAALRRPRRALAAVVRPNPA